MFSVCGRARSLRALFAASAIGTIGLGAGLVGCGDSQSPAPSGGSPTASASAALTPTALPLTAHFVPGKSALLDAPALAKLPASTAVALVIRTPALFGQALSAVPGFSEASAPLAKELAGLRDEISKDLPDIAALTEAGIDMEKPAGVAWLDAELEVAVLFAAVADEAKMKAFLAERAKQSNGKRALTTVGEASLLRAKKDVTRAVVLRAGHVYWIRGEEADTGEAEELTRVVRAADALIAQSDDAGLAASPAFRAAVEPLAFGAHAGIYVGAGALAQSAIHRGEELLRANEGRVDELKKALEKAEKRKQQASVDEVKQRLEGAERYQKRAAEEHERRASGLRRFAAACPGLAIGLQLTDRMLQVKAFLPTGARAADDKAPPTEPWHFGDSGSNSLAPFPPALWDSAVGARSMGHFTLPPGLLDHLTVRSPGPRLFGLQHPLRRADLALDAIGTRSEDVRPFLTGEASFATHDDPEEPAPAAADAGTSDLGAPSAVPQAPSASPPKSRRGFTVLWALNDGPKLQAKLEEGWQSVATGILAEKGILKHAPDGSFEITSPGRPGPPQIVRIVGSQLVVSTRREVAFSVGRAEDAAAPRTPPAFSHPVLRDLAAQKPSLMLLLDAATWTSALQGDDSMDLGAIGALGRFGILATLGANDTTQKLEKQISEIEDKVRALEAERQKAKQAALDRTLPRVGPLALFASAEPGGLALVGGVFVEAPTTSALAEMLVSEWLGVGPRWEKWTELSELNRKKRTLEEALNAERGKALDGILRGVGGVDIGVPGGLLGRGWGDLGDVSVHGNSPPPRGQIPKKP